MTKDDDVQRRKMSAARTTSSGRTDASVRLDQYLKLVQCTLLKDIVILYVPSIHNYVKL